MRMWLAMAICALTVSAQNNPVTNRKHLSVPTSGSTQPLIVSANEIDRGVDYPSVIHLKGDVEIRMPVCVSAGAVRRCAGEIVLHADEVDLQERTGQFEARGVVRVTQP